MARMIPTPTTIDAAGEPPKIIREFLGRVNTGDGGVSIAVMDSPRGWSEPGQTPEFDEYTVVLEGALTVESGEGRERFVVEAGQAVHAPAGEWVRYSTPDSATRYVAVCIPAFSPENVHREA